MLNPYTSCSSTASSRCHNSRCHCRGGHCQSMVFEGTTHHIRFSGHSDHGAMLGGHTGQCWGGGSHLPEAGVCQGLCVCSSSINGCKVRQHRPSWDQPPAIIIAIAFLLFVSSFNFFY
jgi:hypothetical protein